MGWALGANDSANVFGPAVASHTLKHSRAVVLCSLFLIAGALLEGGEGLRTLSSLTTQNLDTAFAASLCAALTVSLMSFLKLPVSTSQAMAGAIIGIGLHLNQLNLQGLNKIVICWIGTPLGTIIVSIILYKILGWFLEKLPINIFTQFTLVKYAIILAGCYGSYALGANNVANIAGVYAETGLITPFQALLIGSLSISFGVISYSKKIMITVGKDLVKLDPFSSLIALISSALVIHFYAKLGVPVSSSQAIIGAVLGMGILKGLQTIRFRVLLRVFIGWLGTPLIAGFLSYAGISMLSF